ncbi:hypothetical protein HJFPF1_11009 [Paramyrothecium foliicola]|nr:hypothetical protein HJFPF1_11009 [Paramyrothecium foliicola]
MPIHRRRTEYPTALPPDECKGPQLERFEHHDLKIQWLERLGDDEDEEAGKEGYVFRAIIGGKEYAIKVFNFFDPMSRRYFWGPLLGSDTSLHIAAYYNDPFYNECRAYGKIRALAREKRHESRIVVPCFGYMFLRPRDEQILRDRNVDLGLKNVDLEYQKGTIGGCRARAIVKDIRSEDHGVHKRNISSILKGIRILNHYGVYNGDIRLDNFREGQLVDFGSSYTDPHILLNAMDEDDARDRRLFDLAQLKEMVQTEEISVPKSFRAMPYSYMTLRSQRVNEGGTND